MARAGLGRLIAELRAAPGARDVDEALAQLRVRREGDDAIIESESESESEGVDAMEPASFGVVRIARGIYSSVPTAAGRIELLEMARRAAREEIELHVVVSAEQSHLGRLAIDAPRKVLRAAGVRTAEPGDRFGDERFAHCFFDEEGLLDEIARAGLAVAKRHGFTFTLRARRRQGSSIPPEIADPFPLEVARVTRMVREVDRLRTEGSPQEVVASMRVRGVDAKVRGPVGRARLRRAIGWVDALVPGGANCYRRVLLEIALDAGAARETVVFGLDVGRTGHVAFADSEERTFDVSFAIPPE
jgi:hypothetical protein